MPAPVVAAEENRSRPAAPPQSPPRSRRSARSENPSVAWSSPRSRVLRVLHASPERSLNASEVARAAGLHRGTCVPHPPDAASGEPCRI